MRKNGASAPTNKRVGGHAIVLGASVSGLLTARVLADMYDRITLIERDLVSEVGISARRGVPQGRHAHGLLSRGSKIFEELFPGLLDELVADGTPSINSPAELRNDLGGHLLCMAGEYTEVTDVYSPSRPRLENSIRTRVMGLWNVKLIDGCQVVGLEATADNARVLGVEVRFTGDGTTEVIHADLVVDATGRTGRATRWLEAMGYAPPPEESLKVDLLYVSQHLRPVPGSMGREKVVIIGHAPTRPTGAEYLEQEDGRWILTLIGYGGHHPPTDQAGFLAFAEPIVPPHVFASIRDAEPLSEIVAHRFPAAIRRRYEKLSRFPEGLLVVGDAICSFNPIYAQGMTLAAIQAETLRNTLQGGTDPLARRFFKAVSKPVGVTWQMATGSDLSIPQVEGPRPLAVRMVNAYINLVLAAAERDSVLAERFLKVQYLLVPPTTLMQPGTMARVFAGNLRRR
ncbi:FAD-dependent oxidoreductase [Nocardia salmonicida]|uniref:FAD-dependent oxidoreductase n=1 Tax=Nocardia salmonicida TaxID=53431 RepID=UPI00363B0EDE